MKKAIFVIALFIVSSASFAQVKNNITKSSVSFKIKNLGINTGGFIRAVQASIAFDPAKLADSKIEAIADANSIDTDNESRDNHLKSEDFFDVAKFPKITMRSVSFNHKSGNNFVGQFNLTIKDKTLPVSMPFTYADAGTSSSLKGSFKINRRDFGVGGNSLTLSDDVTITIEVEASK